MKQRFSLISLVCVIVGVLAGMAVAAGMVPVVEFSLFGVIDISLQFLENLPTGGFPGVIVGIGVFLGSYLTLISVWLVLEFIATMLSTEQRFTSYVGDALAAGASVRQKLLRSREFVALAMTSMLTLVLLVQSPGESLVEGDKSNVQRLGSTGKAELGTAVTKTINIIVEGKSDRLQFWNISRRMLFEESARGEFEGPFGMPHWPFGVGIGNFPIHVPLYSDILHSLGAEIHNDWVQAFVELGPIGFFFWTGFLLSLLYLGFRYHRNSLMVACIGGLFAWVFSTQTDFLTARIYGLLWLGGIAAIIVSIAKAETVLTLHSLTRRNFARMGAALFALVVTLVYAVRGLDSSIGYYILVLLGIALAVTLWPGMPNSIGRKLAAFFFLALAAGYLVTALCDRAIYKALVDRQPTVDVVVNQIFSDSDFPSYHYGIGKYLIFSPISDLSRQVSEQMKKNSGLPEQQMQMYYDVQRKLCEEILWMHPTNNGAIAGLMDIDFRYKRYEKVLKRSEEMLALQPENAQMWLFLAQTQLAMGDSLAAGRSIHKAGEVKPGHKLAIQFWYGAINEQVRKEVEKELGSFDKSGQSDALRSQEEDTGGAAADTTAAGESEE